MKVAVIGGGVAGTAAAWSLCRAGVSVIVAFDRPGASALSSGALDLHDWELGGVGQVEQELVELASSLGWSLGASACRVATPAGVLREARGRAAALLDLEPLAGRQVAVADVPRQDWDAPSLARALAASGWARATGTRFSAVALELFGAAHEARVSAYDFAAIFDQPERADELARALGRARGSHDAWLLGPWLGVATDLVSRLRAELGVALGESTSAVGGPAGARFDLARDRLLAAQGAAVARGRVASLTERGDGLRVCFEAPEVEPLDVDRVVLAVGGVAAGGIELAGPSPASVGTAPFRLALDAPVRLELDGRELESVASAHGLDLQPCGLAALERIGIAADGPRARGTRGIFVAGDCVAGRPRTALGAARAGLAAARAAAR